MKERIAIFIDTKENSGGAYEESLYLIENIEGKRIALIINEFGDLGIDLLPIDTMWCIELLINNFLESISLKIAEINRIYLPKLSKNFIKILYG